jgi:DNA-binding CsgD family transcriptional regulator/tetratricopeptide (TPR) repeat protein
MDAAMTGHGGVAMLAGEPGIGKTRTAQELASYAESLGAQVWWGSCHEQQGAPPYWPWVQPIRSYILQTKPEHLAAQMGAGAAEISEIIPEVFEKLPDLEAASSLEPEQARFRLFESISRFLKNVAQSQPMMLVLDDLQWADQPSLLLLEFFANLLAGSKIMLLGTYRDIEVSREHPLASTLAQLTRSDSYHREKLGGLEGEFVGQLIKDISGVEPSQELVQAIYGHTEGNPFFMTEVIRLLGERLGSNGEAEEDAVAALEIPLSVLEVIGQRLNRLSTECEGVLTTAAVIGRQFDFRLLGLLSGDFDESQLLTNVDEALDAYLIQEVPGHGDLYQFSHALVQQTLRERLSSSRRVRLHALIGETLETLYGDQPGDRVTELAHHFFEASSVLGPEKFVKYAILAGEKALDAYAFEGALEHFDRGLGSMDIELNGSDPAPDEKAAALLFGKGCAQLATVERHRLSEAVSCLRRAFDYYAEAGDVDRAVAIAQQQLPMAQGMLAGAAQLTHRALELVQSGSHDEGRLLSQYALHVYFEESDIEAAHDAYTRALVIAQRENDVDLELRTLGIAATVDTFECQYQGALEKGLRGLELARLLDNPRAELSVHYRAAGGRLLTGDLQGAKLHLEAMRGVAERLRDRFWLSSAYFMSAQASLYEGDWGAARQFSDQSLTNLTMDSRCLAVRMQLELELGEFDKAEAYLERLLEAMRLTIPGPTVEYMIAAIGIAFSGRISGDDRRFEVAEAAAEPVLSAHKVPRFVLFGTTAGLGFLAVQRGDSAASSDHYASLTACRGTAMAGFSFVFDRLLGLLAQNMNNLDLAVEHFEDALAFCRKGNYRPELAWSCCDYAEALVQRNGPGDQQRAESLLDESLSISSELAMRPLMDRVVSLQKQAHSVPARAPVHPGGLTQREVEVIRLIAAGRTDREIAEALIVNVRTVTTHVGNILNKTGAANRAEAASFANQHGLVAPSTDGED